MSNAPHEHERGFVGGFVERVRRPRILNFIAKPKKRKKFIDMLHSFDYFDQRRVFPLEPGESASSIEQMLLKKGAPSECYVMSENSKMDGRTMPLKEALIHCYGNDCGTVISCIPGKLAFYQGEGPNQHYILENDQRV